MKISKNELRRLIAEELQSTLNEMSMMSPETFEGRGGYTYTARDDGGFDFVDKDGRTGTAEAGSKAAQSIASEIGGTGSLYGQKGFAGYKAPPTTPLVLAPGVTSGLDIPPETPRIAANPAMTLDPPTAGDYYRAAGADLTKPIPGGLFGDVGAEAAYAGTGAPAAEIAMRRGDRALGKAQLKSLARQARKAAGAPAGLGRAGRKAVRGIMKDPERLAPFADLKGAAGRMRNVDAQDVMDIATAREADRGRFSQDIMENINIDTLVDVVIAELSK